MLNLRFLRREYLKKPTAIVYVVDSTDEGMLELAKEELQELVSCLAFVFLSCFDLYSSFDLFLIFSSPLFLILRVLARLTERGLKVFHLRNAYVVGLSSSFLIPRVLHHFMTWDSFFFCFCFS